MDIREVDGEILLFYSPTGGDGGGPASVSLDSEMPDPFFATQAAPDSEPVVEMPFAHVPGTDNSARQASRARSNHPVFRPKLRLVGEPDYVEQEWLEANSPKNQRPRPKPPRGTSREQNQNAADYTAKHRRENPK